MFSVQAVIDWGAVLKMKPGHIKKLIKGSWKMRATRWHEKYRELHFMPNAIQRYRYTPRKKGYNARKKAKWKQAIPIPLVWSGDSRRDSRNGEAKATYNSGRFTMQVPNLNYRAQNSQVRMADELRTTIPSEEQDLDRFQTKMLEQAIQTYIDWKTENTRYQ